MKLFKARRRKKPGKVLRQKNRLIFLIMLVLFLAVVILGMRSLRSFQTLQNTESWAASLRENPQVNGTNYLIYGIVEAEEETYIDELFFLNFSSTSSTSPQIIFIPGNTLLHRFNDQADTNDQRDTEEDVAAAEFSKERDLASYYTPGNFYQDGGTEMLVNQLSSFLGVPIHHFLEIQYEGIPVLIDDRGGISYKNYTLKGADYLDYFLQSESGEDPLSRALRRANSVQSLVEFAVEKKGLWATPGMLNKVSPYLNTDLSWKELQEFYVLAEPLFDPDTFVLQLPGVLRDINGEPFFEPDESQVAFLMENLGEDFALPRDLITVEVLNGCGTQGAASIIADTLRNEGFKVEDENVGNADHFDYERTQVISRLDDVGAAKQVAEVISGVELLKEPVMDYPVMVTVIIGKDFSL